MEKWHTCGQNILYRENYDSYKCANEKGAN